MARAYRGAISDPNFGVYSPTCEPWDAELSLTWTLFDGLAREKRVARARGGSEAGGGGRAMRSATRLKTRCGQRTPRRGQRCVSRRRRRRCWSRRPSRTMPRSSPTTTACAARSTWCRRSERWRMRAPQMSRRARNCLPVWLRSRFRRAIYFMRRVLNMTKRFGRRAIRVVGAPQPCSRGGAVAAGDRVLARADRLTCWAHFFRRGFCVASSASC